MFYLDWAQASHGLQKQQKQRQEFQQPLGCAIAVHNLRSRARTRYTMIKYNQYNNRLVIPSLWSVNC